MIYTSYFGQLKSLPKTICPISICLKAPDWYSGLQYKKLAPKYDFFKAWKQNHDNDYYIKCFTEQVLSNLNVFDVVIDLYKLSAGKDIALICYESPDDFCHRHLVAEWLRQSWFLCEEFKK